MLDTSTGTPARELRIDLYRCGANDSRALLKSVRTNEDGRTDSALLAGDELTAGVYELIFHAGEYFRSRAVGAADPPFVDLIPVRFGIADATVGWHVPLLLSPYGYSTYRGS